MSSFLADKADARKSKTRQVVDKMEPIHGPRKPEFNLILTADDSPPEDDFGPIEPVVKGTRKRSRCGCESISTVSTVTRTNLSSSVTVTRSMILSKIRAQSHVACRSDFDATPIERIPMQHVSVVISGN